MESLVEELKNNSESFFLVPFYYPGKKAFERVIGGNWNKEESNNHWFLAKHIDAFDKGKDDERIFTYFTLQEEKYPHYNLPDGHRNITITSDLIVEDGRLPDQFTMKISQIKILYFSTGFGFLIYQIDHSEDGIEAITNKSFALSRALVPDRKSGKKVKLSVSLSSGEGDESAEQELNLADITSHLLEIEGDQGQIELFPNSCKNQCYMYHRIQLSEPVSEDVLKRELRYLREGFHTSFYMREEQEDGLFDFKWKQSRNLYWVGSMKGVVSLSYCIPGENNYFVTKQYCNYVRNDYFLLYMILLHQRQALLFYNYMAVKNQKRMRVLNRIKKELIRFRIRFAYKTVSDEHSYQRFYNGMYECLSLDTLNSDIQDVIDRVTEDQDLSNEKRMNVTLALIAMFSVFSALADGIGFADRMMGSACFSALHWITFISVGFIVLVVIGNTVIGKLFKK